MAEYVEVMKQKKRMCNSTLCCKCDIFHFSGENVGNCPQFISNNPSKAEKIIMAWAAKHPEPVYPTWAQYFNKIRISNGCKPIITDVEWLKVIDSQIPADIAQKLGLEMKEGV